MGMCGFLEAEFCPDATSEDGANDHAGSAPDERNGEAFNERGLGVPVVRPADRRYGPNVLIPLALLPLKAFRPTKGRKRNRKIMAHGWSFWS